jgi:DNA-binding PadR family transcriptional regulator
MNRFEDELRGLGRFSEPALLILGALADGPKHGYAMTQDIARASGRNLGPGTLYGAITRLEALEWIEGLPSEDQRRPYRITEKGSGALQHGLAAIKSIARAEARRLVNA